MAFPRSDRPYHHGSLRQTLIERATSIIGTEGADTVSLRSLARDIGVSHAAPARHFPAKADLLKAVAIEGAEAMVGSVAARVERAEDDPFARLAAAAAGYIDWARNNPAHYRAVRNPEVTRHAEPEIAERIDRFAAVIRQSVIDAQAQGWRADVPPQTVLFQFVAVITGTATLLTDPIYAAVEGPMDDADAVLDQLLERLLG